MTDDIEPGISYQAGAFPGVPGTFSPGYYTIDYTTHTITFIGGIMATSQALTFINVKDPAYAAIGDGVADDTAAIQAAINAAANGSTDGTNVTGGVVFFPQTVGNTYLHRGLTLYNNVHLLGSGATILKLANGANADVVMGYNAPALMGSTNAGGIYNWSISNLTLDGNRGNQTAASYGLRAYGYGFRLQNVTIRYCYSDGLYLDWNGGGTSANDSMEAWVMNCKIHDCNGIGVNFHGPHDSMFTNVVSFLTGSHAFYVGPNTGGTLFNTCHGWGMATGVNALAWLIEGGEIYCQSCEGEGADTVQVVLLADRVRWEGGAIFGGNVASNSVSGIQIGQNAGGTPYANSINQSGGLTTAVTTHAYYVNTNFKQCEGPNGSVWFVNDGAGHIEGMVRLTTDANANLSMSGTFHNASYIKLLVNGVTSDGSAGKGGRWHAGLAANKAFTLSDGNADLFNFNTSGKRTEWVNGAIMRLYSDNYSTRTLDIGTGNTISLYKNTTAAVVATGGTITTSGLSVSTVNPASAVTGVILQAGTLSCQTVWVVNESSTNSVTFAAAGTSNVAQGASMVIQPNSKQMLLWDNATNLWV